MNIKLKFTPQTLSVFLIILHSLQELLTCWYMGFIVIMFLSYITYADPTISSESTVSDLANGLYWGVVSRWSESATASCNSFVIVQPIPFINYARSLPKRWFRNLLFYLFVQVFQNWDCTVFCFAIFLANRVMVERVDKNASFGPQARNIRYLENILWYSASYLCRQYSHLKF